MEKKTWSLSKIALVIGILALLAGTQNSDLFLAGISIILGTLAYRSAKSRETKPSSSMKVVEIVYLVIMLAIPVFFSITLGEEFKKAFVERLGLAEALIPAWAITAYLSVVFKDRFAFNGNKSKRNIVLIAACALLTVLWMFILLSI